MDIRKEKFESLYLDKLVKLSLKEKYLERTGKWIESPFTFQGHLRKSNNNYYYYLEEEYKNPNSIIYGYCFSIQNINSILIKDENKLDTKKKGK